MYKIVEYTIDIPFNTPAPVSTRYLKILSRNGGKFLSIKIKPRKKCVVYV